MMPHCNSEKPGLDEQNNNENKFDNATTVVGRGHPNGRNKKSFLPRVNVVEYKWKRKPIIVRSRRFEIRWTQFEVWIWRRFPCTEGENTRVKQSWIVITSGFITASNRVCRDLIESPVEIPFRFRLSHERPTQSCRTTFGFVCWHGAGCAVLFASHCERS